MKHVRVYAAYWAPLTEGKVTLAQTVVFLFTAALSGMRHAFAPLRRYFGPRGPEDGGRVREFRPHRSVLFSFLVALVVLLALVVMNGAITVAQSWCGGWSSRLPTGCARCSSSTWETWRSTCRITR